MTSLNNSNEAVEYQPLNKLALTVFPNRFATAKSDASLSWEQLVSDLANTDAYPTKADLPYVKLAVFGDTTTKSPSGNSYRCDANVLAVSGVEGDYDAEAFPPDKAAQLLESVGIKCFIYTSASYTQEKPRWRLLAPFSQPLQADLEVMRLYRSEQLAKIDNILNEGTGLFARESYVLSQAFLFGRVEGREYLTFNVEGENIDRLELDSRIPCASPPVEPKSSERTGFNLGESMQALFSEANYHQSLIRIAAHYAAKGVPREANVEMLQGIFNASPNRGDKWPERYDYIPTAVDTAMRKFAPQKKETAFTQPKPLTKALLTEEPPPIPVLIPHIIPRDVFGLVGPGGVAKTTFALYLMVHVITGREIWGEPIIDPGACLFISAEDPIGTVRVRIYSICKELNLSEEEQEKVASNLFIEDVTGRMVRFVEADNKGNLSLADSVNELTATYSPCDIKLVMADPAVFFGAGERFVNDNEATLMQAGRTISKGLNGAAVGFIHHMSKAGSKEKDDSMHAGRGGAAFGDNSRSMLVMHVAEGKKGQPKLPASFDTFDIGTKIYITIAKFSVGKRLETPLWFLRHESSPFKFTTVRFEKDLTAEKRDNREAKEKEHDALFIIMRLAIEKAEIKGEKLFSKNGLHAACKELAPDSIGGVNGFGGLVDLAISRGQIEVLDLPEHLIQGARKTYFANPGSSGNSVTISLDGMEEFSV